MYERYYQEFCNEVHTILSCYLFWKMINKRVSEDKKLLFALNKAPLSWNLIRHSLTVTLFITLGRVFEEKRKIFSVDKLLKCCINEINSFNLQKLRERKMEGQNGFEPEWLLEYIQKAHEPSVEDFQQLSSEVAIRRKIYEDVYRPIRHKLIAHKNEDYMGKEDELWAKTNTKELEKIIWFLYDLKETLFDTYWNGKQPLLMGRKPDVNFYERDFGKLMDIVKNA